MFLDIYYILNQLHVHYMSCNLLGNNGQLDIIPSNFNFDMYLFFLFKNSHLQLVADCKLKITISAFSVLVLGFLCVLVSQLEESFVAFHSLKGMHAVLLTQGLLESMCEGILT